MNKDRGKDEQKNRDYNSISSETANTLIANNNIFVKAIPDLTARLEALEHVHNLDGHNQHLDGHNQLRDEIIRVLETHLQKLERESRERLEKLEREFGERLEKLEKEQFRAFGEAHRKKENVFIHTLPSVQHVELQRSFERLKNNHFENAASSLTEALLIRRLIKPEEKKEMKMKIKASLASQLLKQGENSKKETDAHEDIDSFIDIVLRDAYYSPDHPLGQSNERAEQALKIEISSKTKETVGRLSENAYQFQTNLSASNPPGELKWFSVDTVFNPREHIVAGAEDLSVSRVILRTIIPAYFVGDEVMGEALVQLKPLGLATTI